ncbi:MAG: hypothetical protein AAF560_04930 [Acidobacteriota bacterium]
MIDPTLVAEYEQSSHEFLKAAISSVPCSIFALRGKGSVYTYLASCSPPVLEALQRLGRERARGLAQRGLIVPDSRREWTLEEWNGGSRKPAARFDDVVFFRLTMRHATSAERDQARRAVQRVATRTRELESGLSTFRSASQAGGEVLVVGEGAQDRRHLLASSELLQLLSDDAKSASTEVIEGVAYPALSFPSDQSLARAMWPATNGVYSKRRSTYSRHSSERSKSSTHGGERRREPARAIERRQRDAPSHERGVSESSVSESDAASGRSTGRVVPLEPLPMPPEHDGELDRVASQNGYGTGIVPMEPLPTETTREETEPGLPSVVEIESLVEDWAQAWSEQRIEDYLQFYSLDFQPPEGRVREQWASRRRARIAAPNHIFVTVGALRIGSETAATAYAEFVQSYRSNRYRDTVMKRLDFVPESGSWKIVRERVVSTLSDD